MSSRSRFKVSREENAVPGITHISDIFTLNYLFVASGLIFQRPTAIHGCGVLVSNQ